MGTAAVVVLGLVGAGTASAHVSAQPGEAPAGGSAAVAFRVPNERSDAGTVAVTVTFPEEHPLTSVSTRPLPGWTSEVTTVEWDEPVEAHGVEVTEAISSVTWTAEEGVRIEPGEFQEFEVSLSGLPEDVDVFVMPAEQTYDSGEVVSWTDPPSRDGTEPDLPAPTLRLVEDTGGHHGRPGDADVAAAPVAGGAEDGTARVLGGLGLAVGALGLGLALGVLVRTRRR
ncbi:YcnI family protein [Actinoalloteichus spitiensis]|uniref:YcnI family copper-binding membrane protein n=1 Tax=Actinoalloteichus spitiensis TaxID=252394 RepID=UPI00036A1D92|nr:YcnI family protein [Actinoalloteichus spitiensis]